MSEFNKHKPKKDEKIGVIPNFKVICSHCNHQIKNNDLKFANAPNYTYLKCNNCNNLDFNLIKGD